MTRLFLGRTERSLDCARVGLSADVCKLPLAEIVAGVMLGLFEHFMPVRC